MLRTMGEFGKQAAGAKAAELIENGMVVGLGTGSTAAFFIKALTERKDLRIKAVSSSKRSEELAKAGGIRVLDINDVSQIDITVDGADQVDHKMRMIKGGGGALTREKILASSSAEMVVIVDESKVTKTLGTVKLPLEIVPFGSLMTKKKIEALGFSGKWRPGNASDLSHELFLTDNGNYIFDIFFETPPNNPEKTHEDLIQLPGIVETGFFFNLASKVIVGKEDKNTYLL